MFPFKKEKYMFSVCSFYTTVYLHLSDNDDTTYFTGFPFNSSTQHCHRISFNKETKTKERSVGDDMFSPMYSS